MAFKKLHLKKYIFNSEEDKLFSAPKKTDQNEVIQSINSDIAAKDTSLHKDLQNVVPFTNVNPSVCVSQVHEKDEEKKHTFSNKDSHADFVSDAVKQSLFKRMKKTSLHDFEDQFNRITREFSVWSENFDKNCECSVRKPACLSILDNSKNIIQDPLSDGDIIVTSKDVLADKEVETTEVKMICNESNEEKSHENISSDKSMKNDKVSSKESYDIVTPGGFTKEELVKVLEAVGFKDMTAESYLKELTKKPNNKIFSSNPNFMVDDKKKGNQQSLSQFSSVPVLIDHRNTPDDMLHEIGLNESIGAVEKCFVVLNFLKYQIMSSRKIKEKLIAEIESKADKKKELENVKTFLSSYEACLETVQKSLGGFKEKIKDKNETSIENVLDFQFYEKTSYGDGGNHFCEICNDHFKDVTQFLIHLHLQIHHTFMNKTHKPWTAGSNQHVNGKIFPDTWSLPLQGVNSMIPVKGFFCSLCELFCGDLQAAEEHLLSRTHNENYLKSIEKTKHSSYEISCSSPSNASTGVEFPDIALKQEKFIQGLMKGLDINSLNLMSHKESDTSRQLVDDSCDRLSISPDKNISNYRTNSRNHSSRSPPKRHPHKYLRYKPSHLRYSSRSDFKKDYDSSLVSRTSKSSLRSSDYQFKPSFNKYYSTKSNLNSSRHPYKPLKKRNYCPRKSTDSSNHQFYSRKSRRQKCDENSLNCYSDQILKTNHCPRSASGSYINCDKSSLLESNLPKNVDSSRRLSGEYYSKNNDESFSQSDESEAFSLISDNIYLSENDL